jgi:SAM-dependent methyltransferase
MTNFKRWRKAQEYERRHWQQVAENIASKQVDLDWYAWKVRQLQKKFLSKIPHINIEEENILEIGSGPVGIIAFLGGKRRCAIDPLTNFFEKNPILTRRRDKNVEYFQGNGESLPFGDGDFSFVIIDNVIDHTDSPGDVLKEIFRVLAPGGYLYLMVNVHTRWGIIIRHLMEMFLIDTGHPHSYTQISARQLVNSTGFDICHEEIADHKKARQAELRLGHFRSKLKVIFGISDIQYELLAEKR